jgi:hypothetical protein
MSGTQEDMVEERNAVDAAIRRLHHNPVRAETMGSQARPSREAILKAVRDCDVYIGVFDGRYGWIVPDLDISATQLEYEEAFLRKPTLIYVKDASNVEDRQKDFLKRAQDFDGGFFRRPPFKTAEELASWIEADVTALVSERFTQPDLAPRRQLAYAYAREVQLRFEEWRSRYATLTARSETVAVPEPGLGTPREFRPPGSRSTYNLEDRAGPGFIIGSAKYPGVIAAVNAAGGDAVLLGEPGAGKTTSL